MNAATVDSRQEMLEDPLYVMTVELEKDRSESLKIYAESKPEELAYEFCKKNNLDYVSMEYLANQIKNLFNTASNRTTRSTHQTNILEEERSQSDCIIEEEDEEPHHSYQKANTSEHLFDFIPGETKGNSIPAKINNNDLNNNNNQDEERKTKQDKNLYENNETEESQSNNERHIINKNNSFDSKLVLSYQQFYNNLKKKMEDKELNSKLFESNRIENKFVTKIVQNQQLLIKTSNDKEKLSIAYNEKKYNEYLKQLKNFDEIFQNKQHNNQITCVLNYDPNFTSNTNKNLSQDNYASNCVNTSKSLSYLIETNNSNFNYNCNRYHQWHSSNNCTFNRKKIRNISISSERIKRKTKHKINKTGTNYNNTPFSIITNPYSTEHTHCFSTFNFKSNSKRNMKEKNYSHKYIQRSVNHKSKHSSKNTGQHFSKKDNYIGPKEDKKELTLIDNLFTKKKEEIFKQLFEFLDSTKEHIINIETMNTSRIPSTIYNIIKLLINKIKHRDKKKLNENEFMTGCFNSFDDLSFNHRRALLDYTTKIKQNY